MQLCVFVFLFFFCNYYYNYYNYYFLQTNKNKAGLNAVVVLTRFESSVV